MTQKTVARVRTIEVSGLLRLPRRRHARRRGDVELTYRDLATGTGWSFGVIGAYFGGRILPPTDGSTSWCRARRDTGRTGPAGHPPGPG